MNAFAKAMLRGTGAAMLYPVRLMAATLKPGKKTPRGMLEYRLALQLINQQRQQEAAKRSRVKAVRNGTSTKRP